MLLYWYFVKEFIFPLILSVGVISSILLMDQIYKFIPFLQTSGLEIKIIFQMILFSMPMILMVATPIGVMIAVYAGVYRISSDYEIISMRAAGISLSFLLKPVFSLSIVVALFVMVQTFYLSPIGIRNLDQLKFNILKKQANINLESGKINNFFGQNLIYVKEKEGMVLKNIFISNWDLSNSDFFIEAKKGTIDVNEKTRTININLKNGRIHSSKNSDEYQIIDFMDFRYDLIPPQKDMRSFPQRFRKSSGKLGQTSVVLTVDELWDEIKIANQARNKDSYYGLNQEFHSRIVNFLSCIAFGLFALPIGLFNPRNPKTGKFIYMISMVIVYFVIFSQLKVYLSDGKIPPVLLYSPLLLAFIFGGFSYLKINYDINSLSEFLILFKKVKKTGVSMEFMSTRGQYKNIGFQQVVLEGLARDGGLFVPSNYPDLSHQLEDLKQLSYGELAFEIFQHYTHQSIPEIDLKQIIENSYATFQDQQVTPLNHLSNASVLELFHGPTLAFKDVALQFLGNLFEWILSQQDGQLNILGATSGDTGSAAIMGVRGKKNINIFILHPKGKVSEIQEKQMTTVLDNNVFNIAIEGTFDDGQTIIKEVFNDLDFKDQYHLGAINSINFARVMAQIVY